MCIDPVHHRKHGRGRAALVAGGTLVVVLVVVSSGLAGSRGVGAVAAPRGVRASPIHNVTMRKVSANAFSFTYVYKAPAGSPPVNGATIQITSGDVSILQSVTFGGVAGKPTGAQSAFSFYPLNIQVGVSTVGSGMTSAPLADGTTFKLFFTTDAFSTTTNTQPVDATLAGAAATGSRPNLEHEKTWLEEAITVGSEGIVDVKDPLAHAPMAVDALVEWRDLEEAEFVLKKALSRGEIDKATAARVVGHLDTAQSYDTKASTAAKREDALSAKHRLTQAVVEKEAALHIIDSALNKP